MTRSAIYADAEWETRGNPGGETRKLGDGETRGRRNPGTGKPGDGKPGDRWETRGQVGETRGRGNPGTGRTYS
jgi:hypothetical protein